MMRQSLYGLKYSLRELVLSLKYSFMRDPCTRCLIRVMCSEECSDRTIYYKHTGGMQFLYRITAFSLIISLLALIISIYRYIIN